MGQAQEKDMEKKGPIDHVVCGSVCISIFENEGKFGPRYRMQPQTMYKDREDPDGPWKYTDYVDERDIGDLMLAAIETKLTIQQWKTDARKEEQGS